MIRKTPRWLRPLGRVSLSPDELDVVRYRQLQEVAAYYRGAADTITLMGGDLEGVEAPRSETPSNSKVPDMLAN